MFANHAATLKNMGAFDKPVNTALLDAVEAKKKEDAATATLDAAGAFAVNDIRQAAVAAVGEWAGTVAADLDEGETMADRLIALHVGIADENKDGDISEEESEVINIALNATAEYLVSRGADEADVVALLESSDSEAGDRIAELLKGDEGGDVESFVFDSESSESVMDSVLAEIPSGDALLDATYKKKVVIRAGKKVRINKRVSGHVRLSAGQKVAIRKAGLKSRSSTARMHRMKSMKIRRRAGL